jgi:intein/homing endonuclease
MKQTPIILEHEINNIKHMYLEENKTPKEIGEIYGVQRHRINYLLKKYGIQKTVSEAKRKYQINEHYFDKIDTPNKAYILGFLYADGYNNRINNTIILSLNRKDEDILLKIKEEVGSNKPIYHHNYINSSDGVERHMSELNFASKHMCEQLEKFGMIQNKTFTIDFPNFLPDELISHFIRGYFDGDGCACLSKDKSRNSGTAFQINIMSSMQLCLHMQEYLKNKQNISFQVNKPSGKKELNGLIRSKSKNDIKNFINYIYKNAELYMERKYNKCLQFLKEID